MKKHSDQIRVILFAVIGGAILIYVLYRCTEQKPHYIQEDKTINLKDLKRNIE